MSRNFKNEMLTKNQNLSGDFTFLNESERNSKLALKGGFSALSLDQLRKINGGQKDKECENGSCVNGSCGGEANSGYCVNGNC